MSYLLLKTIMSSFLLTLFFIPILSKIAFYIGALDKPNKRKVHTSPTPRIGGIAIAISVFLTLIFSLSHFRSELRFIKAFLLGSGIIVIFGFIDDIKNLDFKIKFLGQIISAIFIIVYGKVSIISIGNFLPYSICLNEIGSFLLTLLIIVGITNAINLADGLDGLAGGICFLSFLCIGFLAYKVNMMLILVVSLAMNGAIAGFLRFNTYPATVFMGDSGSQFLGFTLIVLAIKLTQEDLTLSPFLSLLICGFPVVDTLSVILQRIYERRPIFKPDKNHFHHKLLNIGLYHPEAVTLIYFIHFIFIISAIFFYIHNGTEKVIFLWYMAFSTLCILSIFLMEKYALKIERFKFITYIKFKLKIIKQKTFPIKITFFFTKYSFYSLILFIGFISSKTHNYLNFLHFFLLLTIICSFTMKKYQKLWQKIVRILVYVEFPVLVYLCEKNIFYYNVKSLKILYNLWYMVVLVLGIFTLKLTRRRKGFEIKPIDYLILFAIIFILNLNESVFTIFLYKIIILFYVWEILIGELRGNYKELHVILTLLSSLVLLIEILYFIKN